jgi:hypothetical protein
MPAEITCRGFLGTGSDAALFVHLNAKTVFGHWVPRSQIRRLTKFPFKKGERQEVEFTVPEWLVKKNNMEELIYD